MVIISFILDNLIYIIFIINIVISVTIIVLERKQPEKTIAWLLVFILLPPIGLILYIFLGRNWKLNKLNTGISKELEDLINPVIENVKDKSYRNLMELVANNSQSPIFMNNEVTVFNNGEEKFTALKEELLKAKHHIHLEYYIVKSDTIGNEIKDILVRKAKKGVKIRFIMDRVGSIKVKKSYLKELEQCGAEVIQYSYFLAPILRRINTQINYRNHRKVVIIDGKVGFLGGINIGDEYLGNGPLGFWRDTHLMIKGDFVLGLQSVFLDDFMTIQKANNKYTFYDKEFSEYFPTNNEISNSTVMQIVKSGPDSTYPAIMQSVISMIYMATDHIYITTPYFVPPESVMDALKTAILSGINVKILVPATPDHLTVYLASRTYLAEIIKCGGEIYLYRKDAFIHGKILSIDGKISNVGSANMDIRSYELNYELNSIIYNKDVTKKLEDQFFEDLKCSNKLCLDDFESSTKIEKLLEGIARVFSSLL